MTIVIVVGIVILSISTFGTAIPVIAVGVVGAIVGISGQLISDIISCAITGDWDGNWQSYIGSAAAYSLWAVLLKHNPVSKVAIFGFMNPVCGVLLSTILLDEKGIFGVQGIAALILVCSGIFIVQRKGNK